MFIIVARTASLYGVVDTSDNVVEWFYKDQIDEIVRAGIQVQGYLADGSIVVNPAYCPDYRTLNFKNENNVFDLTKSIRCGNNGVEFVVNKKIYKMRLLMNTRVTMGDTIAIKEHVIKCNNTGYLVKLSNGICTILPDEVFEKFKKFFKVR